MDSTLEHRRGQVFSGASQGDKGSHFAHYDVGSSYLCCAAPKREEEGRAYGHRVATQYQGDDERSLALHHTLVKG